MSIHFEDVYARILDISCCQTQFELARVLGISQAFVSDAKRRGTVPAEWLVTLHQRLGANSDWILTGQGAQFSDPTGKHVSSHDAFLLTLKQLQSQPNSPFPANEDWVGACLKNSVFPRWLQANSPE